MKRTLLILGILAALGCHATDSTPFVRLTCWAPDGKVIIGTVAPREEFDKVHLMNLPCIVEDIAALPSIPSTPIATTSPEPTPAAVIQKERK